MSALQSILADDAGALLVRSGLVASSALDDARARQAVLGGTLGEQLVFAGVIGDDVLTEFYRQRLLVPKVNPNLLARLAPNVIQTIPADMAIELRAIPVQLDNDTNLTVAMGDPSDSHAVDEIGFFTGTYVVRAVATQMQIAWCLAHYYGHVTPLGQRLLTPQAGQSPTPVSPRPKGLTSRVNAARHRALAPITAPVDVLRPKGAVLDGEPPPAPLERRSEPEIIVSRDEAVPEQLPRARTASGEIRIPPRRAESIRPAEPAPLDESGPVITIEVSEDATGPARKPAARRRVVKTDPPELAARAGEVEADTGPVRLVDLEEPRVVISLVDERDTINPDNDDGDDDDTGSVVIHSSAPVHDRDSQPILLERRRPSDPPTSVLVKPALDDADTADPDDEVVELSTPKHARAARLTQIGIGALPAVTARVHRDTDAIPSVIDDAVTTAESMPEYERDPDPTRVELHAAPPRSLDDSSDDGPAAPPGPASDDTNPNVLAAPPAPAPRPPTLRPPGEPDDDAATDDPDGDDDDHDVRIVEPRGGATSVMTALELDDAVPQRRTAPVMPRPARRIEHDDVDDGWGPPGTTIPPPLLGALPGTEDRQPSGIIPIASFDSAPLIMAPATPPEVEPTGQTLVRSLEESTARAVDLIRTLEHAQTRDDVVARMIAHLAETHRRAGFLSIKNGELTVFAMTPKPQLMPVSALRLDRPSTFQDVVGTRLPYRGPVTDEASRLFLSSALGMAPPEILLVPVAVRERVVGVLFGEQRSRHTFDDQLGLAARAAGMALERILKKSRGS